MGSIIFKTIVGIIAGVAVWAVVEPFKPGFATPQWGMFELVLMWGWAIALGASVGFMNGLQRGSRAHALREMGFGVLFAVIGVSVGRGLSTPFAALINSPLTVIGRTGALALIGMGMGAGIGYCTLVVRRGIQGAIGGLIGGGIAGFVFDIVGSMLQGITLPMQGAVNGAVGEVGAPSRAITAALMCGAIALMIGIVEALSKSAWLRLELGRNEGKEWVIDKPMMTLGRHERADIPLFGDANVAPNHAVIQKQGGQYIVVDQGSPVGIGVNGQRVSQHTLQPNDVIQLGSVNLRFITKNVKAPARGPEPGRAQAFPIGGQMPAQPQMGQPLTQFPNSPLLTPNSQPVFDPTVAIQPQTPHSQTPTLVALDGPLTGQRFPLSQTLELGRESQQVPLAFDSSASRRHTRIDPQGTQVSVSDLGSTNGTFINGQRVTNGIAKTGDIIKVGATSFRIES
ncbi:MAG: FHA domain-containing protein [Armatimonadota bacterium]